MPTLISSLFLIAAIAQEPPARLNLGELWQVDVQAQASGQQLSRTLNVVGGDPLLVWLSTSGPICSLTAPGLPTSGNFLTAAPSDVIDTESFSAQPPTVHILPYSPQQNGEVLKLRIEPGSGGAVVVRVAKLESVIQYARQQWPNYEQELPFEALTGLLNGADIRLNKHAEANLNPNGSAPPPPWLRGFIQLLQSKQIAAAGRGAMRDWWTQLLASPFKLSASLEIQIQEAIGILYQADGEHMRALLQFRNCAIQAKQADSKKRMTSALNRLETIVQDLPSADDIYANLSDLAGMELTTPSMAYLLAEAQWELGLFEEAQHNLWTVQKSLVAYQQLGSHCRVHNLLGAVAMELEQWKMARWHLEHAVEAGQDYLRDTPATTSGHQQIRAILAEVYARQAKVLDTVMEPMDADKALALAFRTLPHGSGKQARLLTLEIATQLALQRGRISSAKSHLLKAEETMTEPDDDNTGWRGVRSAQERVQNLSALTADLAWAAAPAGRGKSVWSGLAAVDRWRSGEFQSRWMPTELVRNLPQDVAVIEYTRGLNHLYAFRTDATGVMVWRLGEFDALLDRCNQFMDGMQVNGDGLDQKKYLNDSYYLYDKLLKPVVMKTDRQLWISTPEELKFVPLHVLANRPGQAYARLKTLADASLVFKDQAIAYISSARQAERLWNQLAKPSNQAQNPALAFQQAQLGKMAENSAPHAWLYMQYPGN